MIWVIVIGGLIFWFVIRPFLRHRKAENFGSYLAVPDEVKFMINSEQVFELSELLVHLEQEREFELCKVILQAIDSKGFAFSRRVDKVRNEMRIRAGMGSLKNF
jgi:hypothetical protein